MEDGLKISAKEYFEKVINFYEEHRFEFFQLNKNWYNKYYFLSDFIEYSKGKEKISIKNFVDEKLNNDKTVLQLELF